MRAALLDEPGRPLRVAEVAEPSAGPGQLLLRVEACGVCRTDLHLRDGEVEAGPAAADPRPSDRRGATPDGRRFGVPWLGWTDGDCEFCRSGRENLCVHGALHGQATSTAATPSGRSPTSASASRCRRTRTSLQLALLLCGGSDRLSRAAPGRRRRAARALRVRLRRAHHLPGRGPPGPARLPRSRARRTRARRRSRARSAPSGPETSTEPGPEPLDAAPDLRPVGAGGPRRAAGHRARRQAWCAPGST